MTKDLEAVIAELWGMGVDKSCWSWCFLAHAGLMAMSRDYLRVL
jgi:hypothetical protein